jgi:hypothetical protein
MLSSTWYKADTAAPHMQFLYLRTSRCLSTRSMRGYRQIFLWPRHAMESLFAFVPPPCVVWPALPSSSRLLDVTA